MTTSDQLASIIHGMIQGHENAEDAAASIGEEFTMLGVFDLAVIIENYGLSSLELRR